MSSKSNASSKARPQQAQAKVRAAEEKSKAREAPLNEKQAKKRLSKAKKSTLKMREQLWPDVTDDMLWLRHEKAGFTTIPRTMPLFIELINGASKHVSAGSKAVPAGKSYLVLWCRVFDEGVVKIDIETVAAMEAGYAGERNVSTWREHLRVLQDLGFIKVAGGLAGPMQYVLILNPYHAVKELYEAQKVQKDAFNALYQRAQEIGANDLDDEKDED